MSDNRSIIPAEAFARMEADLESPARPVPELLELARRVSEPPSAQRDWFASNLENPAHRPAVAKVGAGWSPECGCPDARCERAANPTGRLYPTWDAAWHAARINLENAKEASS